MLIFNSYNFVLTIKSIRATDEYSRSHAQETRESVCCGLGTAHEMDRFYLFVKHFIGIGLLFFFEVISGAFNGYVPDSVWYVTDTLNMFQGFYIFLIFVCNRNVLKAIKIWLNIGQGAGTEKKVFALLPTSTSASRNQSDDKHQ